MQLKGTYKFQNQFYYFYIWEYICGSFGRLFFRDEFEESWLKIFSQKLFLNKV